MCKKNEVDPEYTHSRKKDELFTNKQNMIYIQRQELQTPKLITSPQKEK